MIQTGGVKLSFSPDCKTWQPINFGQGKTRLIPDDDLTSWEPETIKVSASFTFEFEVMSEADVYALTRFGKTAEELRRIFVKAEYAAANWLEKRLIEHREALHDHETNGSWYAVPGWLG